MTASEHVEQLKRCVIAESVYNMLSIYGDTTIHLLVELLRTSWRPAWDDAKSVITEQSVQRAAQHLSSKGLVLIEGDQVRIPVRDPRTRKGRTVRTDYSTAELVWKGRGL